MVACLVLGMLALAPTAKAVTLNGMYQGAARVTSFSFPTSTVSGTALRVRSPDFTAQIASGSVPDANTWRTMVSVTSVFAGPSGGIASGQFAVQGDVQGVAWAALSSEQTVATNLAPATLTSGVFRLRFIPSAGLRAGDYTGTLRIRAQQYLGGVAAGTSDQTVSATVHVLGYIDVLDVLNVTSNVREGTAPGTVGAISFPTQTTGTGLRVRSDSLQVRVNANTRWNLYASVDAPFAKLGDATITKPASSFGVCLASCASVTSFTASGVLASIATANAAGNPALSPLFQMVSRSVNVEAGDYAGSFTLTILVG